MINFWVVECKIRKLKKKLRQIEKLEHVNRDLSSEEREKIDKKTEIREHLLHLLSNQPSTESLDSTASQEVCDDNMNPDTSIQSSETLVSSSPQKRKLDVPREEPVVPVATATIAVDTYTPSKKVKTEVAEKSDTKPVSSSSEVKDCRKLKEKWRRNKFVVRYLNGHEDMVCSVFALNDQLLTGSRDTTVKVWNLNLCTEERSLGGHKGPVTCVQLLSSVDSQAVCTAYDMEEVDQVAFSGSVDCSILIWTIHQGSCLRSIYTFSPVTTLLYLPSFGVLLSGSGGGKIELWDPSSGENLQSIRAHEDAVTSLKAEGSYIYSSSEDGILKVYELRENSLCTIYASDDVKLLSGADVIFRGIHCIDCYNSKIYIGDDGMNVKVLDWKQNRIHKLSQHSCDLGATDAVCVSDQLLLCSGYDIVRGLGYINVRSLPDEQYLATLSDEESLRMTSMTSVKSHQGRFRIVVGGLELKLFEQVSETSEGDDVVSTLFVPKFDRFAHHSDNDTETDEESDNEPDGRDWWTHRQNNREDLPVTWGSWCTLV